jgi:hypothetical protein
MLCICLLDTVLQNNTVALDHILQEGTVDFYSVLKQRTISWDSVLQQGKFIWITLMTSHDDFLCTSYYACSSYNVVKILTKQARN